MLFGMKKEYIIKFCSWDFAVHQSLGTAQESDKLCWLCILPLRKKINYRLKLLYLAKCQYFVIVNYGKFETLLQLCCLGYFCCFCDRVTPVDTAPVIQHYFSSCSIKTHKWLGLGFCWFAMFHDIIFHLSLRGQLWILIQSQNYYNW